MTDAGMRCPACSQRVEPDATYCARCGLQVRMACPACERDVRWLARLDSRTSPWCMARETLLYACETCGRWYVPGRPVCEDPACGGRVLPTRPVSTGRRWDGRGSAVDWRVGGEWLLPGGAPGRTVPWQVPAPVYGGATAHNGLYAWAGSAFHHAGGASGAGGWRTALGPNSRPAATLQPAERIAVVGPAAILAEERRFVAVALHRASEGRPLEGGVPLTQVGSPGFWAGWADDAGTPALRVAHVAPQCDALVPERIEVPAEAHVAVGARMVADGQTAYWQGRDGGLWQLRASDSDVSCVLEAAGGRLTPWVEGGEPRWVREANGRLYAGLAAPVGGRAVLEVPAGTSPLRGVHRAGPYAMVVGEAVTVLDAATGEAAAHPAQLPAGEWVVGVAAETDDGGVRLLCLTQHGTVTSLTALEPVTGVSRVVWSHEGLRPLALLPAGQTLWLVHENGMLGLAREGA